MFIARMLHPLTLTFVVLAVLSGSATLYLLWTRRYF